MTGEEIEMIARRTAEIVVERLREEAAVAPAMPRMLSAAEVAERFAVTADWARANADRLGAVRLGDGPRPRLRFDPAKVEAALNSLPIGNGSPDERSCSGSAIPPRRRRSPASQAAGQSPKRPGADTRRYP
jgi:acyl-CoA reductase-like NAD-dependent aldehyde dehydrogenase